LGPGDYPEGRSALAGAPVLVGPASLDHNNQVSITWNPMAGAIGYNVYYTTTSTAPTGAAAATTLLGSVTEPNFLDNGVSNSPSTGFVVVDGILTARARYDFAIDGDPLAPGLITLANSDTIPKNAILIGAIT
jgi:hypothetical protein